MAARISGSGDRIAPYWIEDDQMAAGSTLGAPKGAIVIKATGAVLKFYSSDIGETLIGTMLTHFWDADTGTPFPNVGGEFVIYPDRQQHVYDLIDGVTVVETTFILNTRTGGSNVDPLAAYVMVEIENRTAAPVAIDSLAAALLRGSTAADVRVDYDRELHAFIACNASAPHQARAFGCSRAPIGYEVCADHGKPNRPTFPGPLSGRIMRNLGDPIALFHLRHRIAAGSRTEFSFRLVGSAQGTAGVRRAYRSAPSAERALSATTRHYQEILNRAVVITPDAEVNRGVLWAKADMLRTQLYAPTGWCFVNDPTRSNNSVGRDTAWFAFGSDYVMPEFSRESVAWYARHLERNGKVVEYYDVRNGKSEDYGLNVNDDTPLIILALWHHYSATDNNDFLREFYPRAKRAANYLLTQRDKLGLIWCNATKSDEWGIAGWRNVIANYRESGATTEVNSECYAAFRAIARMARALGKRKDAIRFEEYATALRDAINEHLRDPETGLYYLNIDVDGAKRTDVTADLVFPVMFGVADHETSAAIISRLSVPPFWTQAGIRTVSRDDIGYNPRDDYGLLGGVWVGVTFWYSFAAASFNPGFMAYALSASFRHYAADPRQNNTVPGQFSEWLNGETLVNQGMHLSPWYPPRYLWAAIEGMAGLDLSGDEPACNPHLAPEWRWLGARNVQFQGKSISWFAVRTPDLTLYTSFRCESKLEYHLYDEDVSAQIHPSGIDVTGIALRRGRDLVILLGNTSDRTITTPLRFRRRLQGKYRVRYYTSLRNEWVEAGDRDAASLERGFAVELDRFGFSVIELTKRR